MSAFTYTVSYALIGIDDRELVEATKNIQDEINNRKYLLNPRVSSANTNNKITVTIEVEGPDQNTANKLIYDELYELAFACLHKIDGVKLELLSK